MKSSATIDVGAIVASPSAKGSQAAASNAAISHAPSTGVHTDFSGALQSSQMHSKASGKKSTRGKMSRARRSMDNPILQAIAEERHGKGEMDRQAFENQIAPGVLTGDEKADNPMQTKSKQKQDSAAGSKDEQVTSAMEWMKARGAMYQQEQDIGTYAACAPRPMGQGWHALLSQRPPGLPPPPPLVLPERLRALLWDWEDEEVEREAASRVLESEQIRMEAAVTPGTVNKDLFWG